MFQLEDNTEVEAHAPRILFTAAVCCRHPGTPTLPLLDASADAQVWPPEQTALHSRHDNRQLQFTHAASQHSTCPMPCSLSLCPALCSAEVLGIHGADVTRAVPIFLAYLATLFHTFSLPVRLSSDSSTTRAALTAVASPEAGTEEALAGDMEAGTAGQQGLPYRRRASERYLGELLGSSVSGGLQSLGLRLLQGCYAGEGAQQRLWFRAGCLRV